MSLEEFIIELDSRGENSSYLGFSIPQEDNDAFKVERNAESCVKMSLSCALGDIKECAIRTKVGGIGRDILIYIIKIEKLLWYLKQIELLQPINILNSIQANERYCIYNIVTKWTESSIKSYVFTDFKLIFQWLQVQREHHEHCLKTALDQKDLLWKTLHP